MEGGVLGHLPKNDPIPPEALPCGRGFLCKQRREPLCKTTLARAAKAVCAQLPRYRKLGVRFRYGFG